MNGPAAAASYAGALAALEARGRFGIRLGLGRTRALLAALGNPEREVRGALVAGTNGKGSVIALAGAACRAAGLRTGETPKPHLVSYRERIVVGGRPIAPGPFAALVAEVLPHADRLPRRYGPATEFEVLTAALFRHLARERVDVALVEVGLGGRLDATHAWDGGVAVVTNVALDHVEHLGPTVTDIAREKAAIVMPGDRAVTGAAGEALGPIRRRCHRVRAPLVVAAPAPVLAHDRGGLLVDLPRLGATRVGLRGRHQAANVAVADALLDALEAAGIATVPPAARRAGYAAARWPGRLELLAAPVSGGGMRDLLLDGAHNPAGAAALAAALDDLRPHLAGAGSRPAPVTVLWATMGDKDLDGILAALAGARALDGARVVTTALPIPRALPAADLAARWAAALPDTRVEAEPDPAAALDRALGTGDGPVVVAGSLALAGFVRARLVDEPDLRDPAA